MVDVDAGGVGDGNLPEERVLRVGEGLLRRGREETSDEGHPVTTSKLE